MHVDFFIRMMFLVTFHWEGFMSPKYCLLLLYDLIIEQALQVQWLVTMVIYNGTLFINCNVIYMIQDHIGFPQYLVNISYTIAMQHVCAKEMSYLSPIFH